MAKYCPDLVSMNDEQLQAFWQQHDPRELNLCGDRLLAESLPHHPRREADYVMSPEELHRHRTSLGYNEEQVAQLLGVTVELLRAWEEGRIDPPASLSLIYRRLDTLLPG